MDNKKKCTLAEFSSAAPWQRMKDKKIPKKQTLHIPSMDIDLDDPQPGICGNHGVPDAGGQRRHQAQ